MSLATSLIKHPRGLIGLLLLASSPISAMAADAPARQPHVRAELISENQVLAPGANTVALRLTPDAGWHTYWRNPGDAGQATTLSWKLPDGFSADPIQWPVPKIFRSANLSNFGYDSTTLHLVDLQVPAGVQGDVDLQVTARWLACSDTCVPEQAQLSLHRSIGSTPVIDAEQVSSFAQARSQLPQAGLGASSYRIADGKLTLRIEHEPQKLQLQDLQFFPYSEGLIDSRKPARMLVSGTALIIEQALLDDAEPVSAAIEGVLVSSGSKPQAWAVQAQASSEPLSAEGVVALPAAAPQSDTNASAADQTYVLVLLFAFLGGLVLNLMPCVFPVLSIKAVSLMQGADQPGVQRRHALTYTAGVVLSCVGAAALLLALRAGGQALGWGFQLQSPFFVGLLAYLMFIMALSLSGALHIGMGLMGTGQNLANREGYAGSFFTGVLAVIVASPCTAPFMGTALGYAITQPWPLALSVFAMLGIGLASPFLLIAWWPAMARRLPRPGAWMETFKQAMAFPLYFTVVWLLWVLGRQAGITALIAAAAGLVLVALCSWSLSHSVWIRRTLAPLCAMLALALLAVPGQPPATQASNSALHWEPYSDERLAELRASGKTVFVDLTADWCITCKVNERVAIDTQTTEAAFTQHRVALLRGDWTRSDPRITAVLERFGRNGVPLYILFVPGKEPKLLPQLLTPDSISEVLNG